MNIANFEAFLQNSNARWLDEFFWYFYIGFWSAMDFSPHKITPEDDCDSNRKIPSKYAKITQDVIKWLMFKDYPNKKKPRQEVLDCLVPT